MRRPRDGGPCLKELLGVLFLLLSYSSPSSSLTTPMEVFDAIDGGETQYYVDLSTAFGDDTSTSGPPPAIDPWFLQVHPELLGLHDSDSAATAAGGGVPALEVLVVAPETTASSRSG